MIKVLIVDDSALMRKLLGRIFAADEEFVVAFARDGVEALALIGAFKPDVVTLDVQMPRMDGLACLDRIMVEHPRPVVMVSSLTADGAATTIEALRLGAVDFVTKPDGAISLKLDALSEELRAKVRTAATVRIKVSARLRDRVRHRIGDAVGPMEESVVPPGGRRAGWPASADADPRGAPKLATGGGLVLVGTSTGGPPALEALLVPLPADFPWPIVVAQHMPATFTGALAKRLDGLCVLTVVEVVKPVMLQAGHVYIGRGDGDVVIGRRAAGLVALPQAAGDYPWHPSTELLVTSAMKHVAASQMVGVLMTGMGTDGAVALAELHAQGGRTIAESQETAVVWGMPGELVRRNGANWTLPLPEIAGLLRRLVP